MRRAFVTLTLALAAAGRAGAQESAAGPSRSCTIEVDSLRRYAQVRGPNGQPQYYGGGGAFLRCAEQPTTITSDSIAWFPDRGELRLLRRVHFSDSTGFLDADRLTYWVRQERLIAQGNVYTRNLKSRSDLRGPSLDYYRAVPPIRDTVELFATGRPTIHFFSQHDTAAGDSARPFVVVADRVHLRGNDRMWGSGHVTIDRDNLAARGDSASLDLSGDEGFLIGNPELRDTTGSRYRLTGRRINFALTPEHDVRQVVSQGAANALGTDWTLRADTLDLAVDSGRIERAQAWGQPGPATATSGLHTIVADSLDIRMPAQVVRLVWAYGHGHATSKPDSVVTEDDWLSGDTLRADFAARDSAARRTSELEHLTAFGSARAYYHTDNDRDPGGERGINYSRGRRIDIAMRESKVRTVDIVGQVDGIYLEPIPRVAPADTTRPDTTAARRSRPAPATPPGRTP